jgi:DNA polymerase sigma
MRISVNPQLNMVELVRYIQPQPSELKAARSHRATVRQRLISSFDISKIVPIGSHSRDTAIRWYSDLDVMAILRRNEAKWGGSLVSSSTLITRVRNSRRCGWLVGN